MYNHSCLVNSLGNWIHVCYEDCWLSTYRDPGAWWHAHTQKVYVMFSWPHKNSATKPQRHLVSLYPSAPEHGMSCCEIDPTNTDTIRSLRMLVVKYFSSFNVLQKPGNFDGENWSNIFNGKQLGNSFQYLFEYFWENVIWMTQINNIYMWHDIV